MNENPINAMLDMLLRVVLMDLIHAAVYFVVLAPLAVGIAVYLKKRR